MSFDALVNSNLNAKKKDISFEVAGKKVSFTANEISYLQRLNLSVIQQSGGDAFTQLVVYSIKDEQGKHMTFEQAQGLSEEHAQAFFVAASEVNKQETEEKN